MQHFLSLLHVVGIFVFVFNCLSLVCVVLKQPAERILLLLAGNFQAKFLNFLQHHKYLCLVGWLVL